MMLYIVFGGIYVAWHTTLLGFFFNSFSGTTSEQAESFWTLLFYFEFFLGFVCASISSFYHFIVLEIPPGLVLQGLVLQTGKGPRTEPNCN
jgi:hypothetical protein